MQTVDTDQNWVKSMADGNVYKLAENKDPVLQWKIIVKFCKIKLLAYEFR